MHHVQNLTAVLLDRAHYPTKQFARNDNTTTLSSSLSHWHVYYVCSCTRQRNSVAGRQSGGEMAALPSTILWRLRGGRRRERRRRRRISGRSLLPSTSQTWPSNCFLSSAFCSWVLLVTLRLFHYSESLLPLTTSRYHIHVRSILLLCNVGKKTPTSLFFNVYKPTKMSPLSTWILFNVLSL